MILLIIFWSSLVFANDYTATSPLQFLKVKPCRISSLGGAGIALPFPNFENPASLGPCQVKEIGLSYNSYLLGIDISSFSYIHPTEERGNFGGYIVFLKTPNIEKTNERGDSIGKFSAYDFLGNIGYGKNIAPNIAIGASFKFIREKIDNIAINAYLADLGIQYRPFLRDITFGLCLSNIGSSIRYINKREDMPITIRGGISASFFDKTLLSTIELDKSIDSDIILRLGFENILMNRAFLRAGYSTESDIGPGISLGFGLNISKYFFDLAFIPWGSLGNTISCSLSIKFLEE